MDKNTGDQLNRAYEAYRQACIEKDTARRELLQKTELYEQQLHDQHEQIASLKRCVALLTSRLSAYTGTGGTPFPPMSPKLDNTDGCKIEGASNVSIEQLQEQLKACMQRERNYKEQLEEEKVKVMEMEENQLRLQLFYNEDVRRLKHLLKSLNGRRNSSPPQETEVRSTNITQEPKTAAADTSESARQGVERIFSDLKEEFNRICKLTKEQSSQLNTFFKKDATTNNHVRMQFSMPVQCTDEENEEAQAVQKPSDKAVRSRLVPITPRGLGADSELSTSVESLSTFSVKFPPSSNELEFLQSAPDNLPVVIPSRAENVNCTKTNTEVPHHMKNFNTGRSSPPYSPHSPKAVSRLDDQNLSGLESNYIDKLVAAAEESSLFLPAKSPDGTCANNFCIPDIDDVGEVTELMVRGPKQSVWQPLTHDSDNLSVASAEKWGSSDVCEFCQAVFPPSTQSDNEFLRHLSTHVTKS